MRRFSRFALALVFVGLLPLIMASTSAQPGRPGIANRYALELDGEVVGLVNSVSGGNIFGQVVALQPGPSGVAKKSISTIKYEPFTVEVGTGMSKALYDWIQASFDQSFTPMSGAVIAVDSNSNEVFRKDFKNAIITEVTIPALNGASKEPAYMTVKFQPESISYASGSGSAIALPPPSSKEKMWLASNFRFELGSLPTIRVSNIESFTWKQSIATNGHGETRNPAQVPGQVKVPNLTLNVSMADFQPWYGWFEDFVINGNNSDTSELAGRIAFLSPDLKTELGAVELGNVGIFSLDMNQSEATNDSIARFTVELYVEEMSLDFGTASP